MSSSALVDRVADAVADTSAAPADASGVGAEDGPAAAPDGATDLADAAGLPGPVIPVSTFGCFARSGDGAEFFADGTRATVVTSGRRSLVSPPQHLP